MSTRPQWAARTVRKHSTRQRKGPAPPIRRHWVRNRRCVGGGESDCRRRPVASIGVAIIGRERRPAATLWVDPKVHAAKYARLSTYVVAGTREEGCSIWTAASAPTGTDGTERRRFIRQRFLIDAGCEPRRKVTMLRGAIGGKGVGACRQARPMELALTRLLKPDSLAHQSCWRYEERCAVLAMVGQYDLALLG